VVGVGVVGVGDHGLLLDIKSLLVSCKNSFKIYVISKNVKRQESGVQCKCSEYMFVD
jgi:hypothetical protein